jgi:protein-tyrosine-phosphatase
MRCGLADEDAAITAGSALKQWQSVRQFHSQSLMLGVGTSRRHISVLVVSHDCVRALLVEKWATQKVLPAFFASENERAGMHNELKGILGRETQPLHRKRDRILLLSAGLDNFPGASVPRSLMAALAEHGVDLTDDNPRAAFDPSDLEHYDFLICVDRQVRERLLNFAEIRSRSESEREQTERLSYSEYEKKIIVAGNNQLGIEGQSVIENDVIQVPKMPDIDLLHPVVLAKHLPEVLKQVDKLCHWTLAHLDLLGL